MVILLLIFVLCNAQTPFPTPLPLRYPPVPSNWSIPSNCTGLNVLVVGATAGIGQAVANIYHACGANVIGTTRDVHSAAETPFTLLELEFGRAGNGVGTVGKFYKKYKTLHSYTDVVDIVGMQVFLSNLLDFTPEENLNALDISFVGPMALFKRFVQNSDPARRLAFGFTDSLGVLNGFCELLPTYAMAKRGIDDLVRTWRLWYGPKYYPNIVVTQVLCNTVNSSILHKAYIPAYSSDEYVHKMVDITAYSLSLNTTQQPAAVGLDHVKVLTNAAYPGETSFTSIAPGTVPGSKLLFAMYTLEGSEVYVQHERVFQSPSGVVWPSYPSSKRNVVDDKSPVDVAVGIQF